jgi:hypothetical protein
VRGTIWEEERASGRNNMGVSERNIVGVSERNNREVRETKKCVRKSKQGKI